MPVMHAANPFHPWKDRRVFEGREGRTIRSVHAELPQDLPIICVRNGEALLRSDWDDTIDADDIVVFVTLPQGGGGSNPLRLVLMIAVMVAAGPIAQAIGGAIGAAEGGLAMAAIKAGVSFVGMALVNAIIPPPKPTAPKAIGDVAAPSPTYSLGAQGNTARIGSSIPSIYGTHIVYPDFAAQPYTEYIANEQYLYMLLVIGQGYYNIDEIRIEDTPIANFAEVTTETVQPGGNVTLFPSNVLTSSETTGQEILHGSYLGPFVANSSGTQANYIAVDVACPKGVYYAADDGSLSTRTIQIQIDARAINDSGSPIGSWTTLGTETIDGATTTAQRRSYRYAVTAGRYEVRVTRLDTKDTSTRAGHDVNWTGLRAYLPGAQAYGDITLLAVRIQATNQLSTLSARKFNAIVTRKLSAWNGSGWEAPAVTQSIAWALADICKAQYGGKRTDAQINLDQLLALDAVWTSRGDKFNAVYDQRLGFWEALTSCARAGRAVPILQGGVIHFIRDGAQTVPVAMFSMRNIVQNSFRIEYLLQNDQTTDAAEAEYMDEVTWKPRTVLAQLPSGTADNPAQLKGLFGVTSRAQAWREAIYAAAQNRYRRKIITFRTELEGFIPTFGDLVLVQHNMPAWGQSAEVAEYGDATNRLTYSQQFTSWTGDATVTAAGNGPNGLPGAYSISDTNGAAWQYRHSNTFLADPGSSWCMSLFVKRDAVPRTTRYVLCRLVTNVLNVYLDVVIDTSTGDCAIYPQGTDWSDVSVTVEVVDDDWFRLVAAATMGHASLAQMFAQIFPAVGYGASLGLYYANAQGAATFFGAQVNPGLTPHQYVPTTNAERVNAKYARLTEPMVWESAGTHYLAARKRDGSVDGPHVVQCSASRDVVVFDTAPASVNTAYTEERTHVAFGLGTDYALKAIVAAVRPRGDQVEIMVVNEDPAVHTADGGSVPSDTSWSLPGTPTTPEIPYDGTNAVAYLSVVFSGELGAPIVTVSWAAAAGADGYYVEQSYDGELWTRIADTTHTSHSFATNAGLQYIRVAPHGANIGTWREWSGTVEGGKQYTAPSAPSGLAATPAGLSIILEWSAPSSPNVEFVEIYRNTTNNTVTAGLVGYVGANVQVFIDTVEASGLTRYYWIKFVNEKGQKSDYSTAASATSEAVGGIVVVASLPVSGMVEGDVVYLTTDKKIYRYNGTTWTAAVDGGDILANTVTAQKMNVANLAAISANLGAITAGSLNINNLFVVDAAGQTTIKSAASGARLEITNSVIRVYDSSGVLRVKLGNLA